MSANKGVVEDFIVFTEKEHHLRKTFFAIGMACTMAAASMAHAAGNAAPFGVELGVATMEQVKAMLGPNAKREDSGQNQYTKGPMFDVDGASLNVEGVKLARFVFDQANVLAGVIVIMDKDPKGLYKTLSAKYKPVSNKIDKFMNYGTAHLEKGDSVILIEAPHLDFTMEVDYITKSLMASWKQTTAEQAASKQKRKAEAL